MSVNLSILAGAGWQFFTDDGVPLAGGLLYTYAAGTTTPQTTYTSSTGLTANTNPIVLNSAGRVANQVWLTTGSTYKLMLQNSVATQIWSQDNIVGAGDISAVYPVFAASSGSSLIGFIQSGTGAVARTAQAKMRDIFAVEDFGAVGDGTTDDTGAIQAALNAAGLDNSVACKGGKTYLCTNTIFVGGTSSRAHALVCQGQGRATLKFNLASHITNGVALRGYQKAGVIYGMEFMPTKLTGFYIDMQDTGQDGVVQFEGDHSVLEDLTVIQPYRNAFSFTPSNNCWIENSYARNLLATKCGQHGFYLACLNANSYINDGAWIDCEVRGVGINSVALGINKTTQPTQLGTAIYIISQGTIAGNIAGHTWVAFTADCGSSYAVANGSAPNPDAVFFANARNDHVIEGAGVAGATLNYGIQWRFLTPRVEDTAAGGFTTGTAFARETATVLVPNLWIDALSGGNWGAMAFEPNVPGDGTYIGSADYAGAIPRIRWNGSFEFNGSLAVDGTNVAALSATGVNARMMIQKMIGASYGNIAAGANADITSFGGNTSGVAFISGTDTAGNDFASVVQFRWFGLTPTVIADAATLGSPVARTYTINGVTGELKLALTAGAGTYAIRTAFILPTAPAVP